MTYTEACPGCTASRSLLDPVQLGPCSGLWLEAPADWPVLTPLAAEALLRLLKRLAARRAEPRPSGRPA